MRLSLPRYVRPKTFSRENRPQYLFAAQALVLVVLLWLRPVQLDSEEMTLCFRDVTSLVSDDCSEQHGGELSFSTFVNAVNEFDNRLRQQKQVQLSCGSEADLHGRGHLQTFKSIVMSLPRRTHTLQNASNSQPLTRTSSGLKSAMKRRSAQDTPPNSNVFIAALLHNNAKVLPFWGREVTKLVLELTDDKAASNVFVSVYESGSADATGDLLVQLSIIWSGLGIAHRIHKGGTSSSEKPPRNDRIRHLAGLRNRALEPMYSGSKQFDRVIYLNDVYFCAADVMKLVEESTAGNLDLACATDFTESDPACLDCAEIQFYDIWVARDTNGKRFQNEPPFIEHANSVEAFARGEPFPVASCWNGAVVIKADLFQAEGMRFRSHKPMECQASECELFCRDLWGLGRSRILMVPQVRTAYVFRTFEKVMAVNEFVTPSVRQARWNDLVDFSAATAPKYMTCCDLPTGASIVQWDACFEEEGWLHSSQSPRSPPPAITPFSRAVVST